MFEALVLAMKITEDNIAAWTTVLHLLAAKQQEKKLKYLQKYREEWEKHNTWFGKVQDNVTG